MSRHGDKPVVAVFFAAEGVPAELAVLDEDGTPVRGSVPSYASPERAAAALARVSRYARLARGSPRATSPRRPASTATPPARSSTAWRAAPQSKPTARPIRRSGK